MATGDFRNNLFKVEAELKSIQYPCRLNAFGVTKGDPAAFLPILHYTLLDYSRPLAAHFAAKGYELYGKKDTRFLEAVYSLLRKEFSYRPQLTRNQFFNMGYAERKLIFLFDVIQACKTLHNNLSKTNKNKKIKKKANLSDNPSSDTIKKGDVTSESSAKNSFGFVEEARRSYSPEVALASLWDRKKLLPHGRDIRVGLKTPSPFPNPLDTYHHDYHDLPFSKGTKNSTIECESIMNHPPSYAFKAYVPGHYDSVKDKSSPFNQVYEQESILSDLEGEKISNSPIPHFSYQSPNPKNVSFQEGPIAFSSPRSKNGDTFGKKLPKQDSSIDHVKLEPPIDNFVKDKSIQVTEILEDSRNIKDIEINELRRRVQDLEDQLSVYKSTKMSNASCQTTETFKEPEIKTPSVQELLAKVEHSLTITSIFLANQQSVKI